MSVSDARLLGKQCRIRWNSFIQDSTLQGRMLLETLQLKRKPPNNSHAVIRLGPVMEVTQYLHPLAKQYSWIGEMLHSGLDHPFIKSRALADLDLWDESC